MDEMKKTLVIGTILIIILFIGSYLFAQGDSATKFYFKTDPAKPEFWQTTSKDFLQQFWRRSSTTDKGFNVLSRMEKILFAPNKAIENFSVHSVELRFNSSSHLIAVYINILNEGDFFPYKKSHEFNYKIASTKTLAELSVSRQKQQEDRQRERMLFPRLDKEFKKTYSTKQKAITRWLNTNYGRHTESFGKFSSDLGSERCQTWATKGTIFNLYSVKDTYISLELLPREKKSKSSRERTNLLKKKHSIKDNVEHLANGDVIIRNIPLVEQGHKGYCAVATVEMVLRYFVCEVSNTQLATLAGYSQGEPGAGLINALSKVVTGKAKLNFRTEPIFIARTARERINQGEPFIVWRYFDRIRDRQISSHSKAVARDATIPPMKITGKELVYFQKMKTGGTHASVVVGFNKQRDEFLLSESWNVYSTLKRFQRKELEATCHRVLIFHPTSPYILGQP